MGWFTALWPMIVACCLTLAAIHIHVWLRRPDARANAMFALLAISVAAAALLELGMMRAGTPAEFERYIWWYHVPVWSGIVAIVAFMRMYLKVGRPWLGWAVIGLRTLSLVVNFFSTPSINFTAITAIDRVTLFGDVVSIPRAIPNPWMALAQAALVLLIFFIVDATVQLWRRGESRRAVSIGGSLLLLICGGTSLAVVSYWGLVRVPALMAIFFVPAVLAMGAELSMELARSLQLAAALQATEAELRGSEQKLALAADAASAGLWSIDRHSGQMWATPRALSMLGLPPAQRLCLDGFLHLVHQEDREPVRALIAGLRRADGLSSVEYRVSLPDGAVRWCAALGRVAGDDGNTDSVMGATIDITERKRGEEEASRQRAALEHLSRVATLSELSGALAHELNQPLATIMSNAEAAQRLLQNERPDLAEIAAILDDIVEADERAGEVIRRLRGLLMRGVPQTAPVRFSDLLRGVIGLLRSELVQRGVIVEAVLDGDDPLVLADRVPIEQVLINVIGNACDAMAGNAPGERCLRISLTPAASSVSASIRDMGHGLPNPPQRVFEPFFTTKPAGLGMGLTISRSIVAAHGGRLWAESNPDRGTTFHIGLTRAPEVPT